MRVLRAGLALTLLVGVADTAMAQPTYGSWGVVLADMDKTVRPGDDFFAHVEGHWLKTTQIAPDSETAGYHDALARRARSQIREIVEDAVRSPSTPQQRQIADFYQAWMDEAGVEQRGLAPASPWLERIGRIRNKAELVALMARPSFAGPFALDVLDDLKDPTRPAVFLGQASLGMPSRDDYLQDDAHSRQLRATYLSYIAHILTAAGQRDAQHRAEAVLALETRIAQGQWSAEQERDDAASYNPMTPAALHALAPEIGWEGVLRSAGIGPVPEVIVTEPSAIRVASRLVADVPLAGWKDYLLFRFLSDHAEYLPRAFSDAHFDFYGRMMGGLSRQSDRATQGIRLLNNHLGDEVGQLYVERHWSAETGRQVEEMVEDLKAAYADQISRAGWMDEATRKAALEKLAAMQVRVGHPEHYIDYTSLPVSRTDLLANITASQDFAWRRKLAQLGKRQDRGAWFLFPQIVNAYNDPNRNQVTFAAAILQPPFFDAAADPAVNYGAAGAIIGHEIGHGFDDQGRHYDAKGALRDWWTPETERHYNAITDALVTQFGAYEPLPRQHINGKLTLGENLGDLTGVEAAYAAYHRYLARHGVAPLLDGYTGDQRFFLSYAQSWQGKDRDDALRKRLMSNVHSPWAYRVNGILRNVDGWYAAFGVQPGDRLYLRPQDRVHLW
jgi:endothelin-converting enzyme/putative endopeptidase